MRATRLAVLTAVFCVLLIALPAAAQEANMGSSADPTLATGKVAGAQPPLDPDWGTLYGIYHWLPASAFGPRNTGAVWRELNYGRFQLITPGTGAGANDLVGPVNLPTGASLYGLRYAWCDNDAAAQIQAWLTTYPIDSFTTWTDLTSSSTGTAATPGCTTFYETPPAITINNNDQYVVNVRFSTASANLDFRGVRLVYRLQVSPAPAAATFTDVPTNYWAFQYIEALAASGITAGCGGSNFCPETPITRAQMAVFLAKALGLFWL